MGERASGLRWVVDLAAIGAADVDLVGGKGARLGELVGVPGVHVPPGFCVTTEAFRRSVARRSVARRSAAPGRRPGGTAIPEDIAAAVTGALAAHGAEYAYAVRSSATAEDLPTASFAGAHESFLNLVGAAAVLAGVRRCWASLGTERAIAYRARNGIDDGTVQMAVVVQRMVDPRASGVLFTADPVTGNRRVSAIETVPGLGDALVTGRVNAAAYRVREAVVLDRPAGVDPVLTDEQAIDLAALGRRIEAHAGCPQDIEWCLTGDGDVHIVQARPITTLFPIPAAPDDAPRAYVSVGHQQMMTDPMRPLGLSIWRRTALAPMHEAGGRLFVEVTDRLAAPQTRAGLLAMIADGDPCTGQALQSLLDRGFLPPPPPPPLVREPRAGSSTGPDVPLETIATDPAIVAELVAGQEASLAALRREIAGLHGPALFAFIDADIAELKGFIGDPVSHRVIMAGFEATAWLNDHLEAWLGERNAADVLTRSVPGNVTAQMGLALLEVADAIRPHPEVIDALERAGDDLDALLALPGGRAARAAITGFLDRYGMRCIGEIDITRPRWREAPSGLMPMLLGNVRNAEPGAGPRRFAQGEREAQALARDVLERLRALPDGAAKAEQTRAMIERVRAFNGYREYPKFVIVNRYLVYRQALLGEGERLGEAGVLRAAEDAFFLTFDELRAAAAGGPVEQTTIRAREAAFRSFGALTPPRVLTSEGEALTGQYRRADLPVGALPGLAVSTGTVEGRARVVADPALDLTEVALEPGDILVARYTDPSATPLFLTAAGLVTEVGGRMTHGAVIAREYGLPAVVGVENATGLICDGRRIRVHGTDGYVELLPG